MLIQLIIEILVGLLGFYYLTVFLHLMGVKIFQKADISIGKSLIPFYYWFYREVVK